MCPSKSDQNGTTRKEPEFMCQNVEEQNVFLGNDKTKKNLKKCFNGFGQSGQNSLVPLAWVSAPSPHLSAS